MIPSDIRLYSWVDVEDVLLRAQQTDRWPEWLVWARVYWDVAAFGVRAGKEAALRSWLQEHFDPRFDENGLRILLEELPNSQRFLQISIEETDEVSAQRVYIPTFARPSVLHGPAVPSHPEPLGAGLPPVVFFHSFKGGVGRTLHAFALAMLLGKQRGARTLLIDADLEAPGISWLIRKRFPNPAISYADFLSLVHSDPDPLAGEALSLTASRIRDSAYGTCFVLSAFRSEAQFQSLEIRPEHLTRDPNNPFRLTSLLARLGEQLGVEAVIVDGRAGLSEISAGLLLDPRVYRVIVGTLTSQSLEGTLQLLQLVGRLAPSTGTEEPTPAIILSQVPQDYPQGSLKVIEDSLVRVAEPFLQGDQPDLPLIYSPLESSLSVLPQDWDDVAQRVERSGVLDRLVPLAEWLPRPQSGSDALVLSQHIDPDLRDLREQLATYAETLIFAESGATADFLNIEPLKNLATQSGSTAPIAVLIGAKGAGKTYTYLQMARRGNWRDFARDAGAFESPFDAPICPILQARNLREQAKEIVQSARQKAAAAIGSEDPVTTDVAYDYIREGLRLDLHEGQWRERWLNVIAWMCGFEAGKETAGRRLIEYLRNESKSLIALFDGIEDLFQELSAKDREQLALRALIQDLPDWLEQQPLRPLGLIVVVRQDMVLASVRQNPAQLMSLYEPFALKWGGEEALRLVLWSSLKGGALKGDPSEVLGLSESELVTRLEPLWGRKLGHERSKEARSAEWVIAALSDFNGQIQARDLVRFLHTAASRSISDTYWKDRVLVPVAVKEAVEQCGKEKVREIGQESATLKEIFEILQAIPPERRVVPFNTEGIPLTIEQIKVLEENGVVAREDHEYYMAEIFRQGLDFRLPVGARPRVLTLARRRKRGR